MIFALEHLQFLPCTGVFLSLNVDIIPNHGYVMISGIGSTVSTALLCHTNRPATFDNNRHSEGNWFAPDGTRVGHIRSTDVPGYMRNRGSMVVRLLRNTDTDPPAEGIYRCVIEDATLQEWTVYVGLYKNGGGI